MNESEILLIEDDPSIARNLSRGLEEEGFTVTWRDTGEGGIKYAKTKRPKLIILDVRLPDSTGFEVCRQIRRLGLQQPVLFLTVRSDDVDKVVGLEVGADDYVTKPFNFRELLARIRALLRRTYGDLSTALDDDVLYAKDLVIDRSSGQVFRGDSILNLTPTEFRLLVYFAQHAGQALTRGQILQAVWGGEANVEDEQMVNVHIHRLREKVEVDPAHPSLILTVPGIGYRLSRE